MLSLIGAKNFKSFKNFSYLKLGEKLTLVYGKNSSGKSSILQVLKILNKSFALQAEGFSYDGVDGEMSEFLHKGSRKKEFSICFDFKGRNPLGYGTYGFDQIIRKFNLSHVRFDFNIKLKGSKNYLDKLTVYGFRISQSLKVPGLGHFTNQGEDIKILELQLSKIEKKKDSEKFEKRRKALSIYDADEGNSSQLLRYKCTYICDADELWNDWYNTFSQEIVPEVLTEFDGLKFKKKRKKFRPGIDFVPAIGFGGGED